MSNLLSEFILGIKPGLFRDKVIIAPCWMPESVGISELKEIGDKSCQVWDCVIDGKAFTYIVTGVGAAICMDIVIALKESDCKEILFIGSAGAIRQGINIGDFAVPSGIISAEGASRFIGDNLSDDVFGKCFFASDKLRSRLLKSLEEKAESYHIKIYGGMGISVESILLQYKHMDELSQMKCAFIDMESSAFLAACNDLGMNCAVVFCISDNITEDEPLYKVDPEKTNYRKKIRKEVMPFVLKEFVNGDN